MHLVAIVLAAGQGTRFGGDKLAALINGRSVLDHVVAKALAAPVERVVMVTRPGRKAPSGPRIERVEVSGPELSDTLRAGIAAAGEADGVFVFLGDMPLVPEGLAPRLAGEIGSALAAIPMRGGAPGHPVLLTRRGFGLIDELSGDRGLGSLLRGRADVVLIPTDDAGATFDIDTPADLDAAHRGKPRAT